MLYTNGKPEKLLIENESVKAAFTPGCEMRLVLCFCSASEM